MNSSVCVSCAFMFVSVIDCEGINSWNTNEHRRKKISFTAGCGSGKLEGLP